MIKSITNPGSMLRNSFVSLKRNPFKLYKFLRFVSASRRRKRELCGAFEGKCWIWEVLQSKCFNWMLLLVFTTFATNGISWSKWMLTTNGSMLIWPLSNCMLGPKLITFKHKFSLFFIRNKLCIIYKTVNIYNIFVCVFLSCFKYMQQPIGFLSDITLLYRPIGTHMYQI